MKKNIDIIVLKRSRWEEKCFFNIYYQYPLYSLITEIVPSGINVNAVNIIFKLYGYCDSNPVCIYKTVNHLKIISNNINLRIISSRPFDTNLSIENFKHQPVVVRLNDNSIPMSLHANGFKFIGRSKLIGYEKFNYLVIKINVDNLPAENVFKEYMKWKRKLATANSS